MHLWGIYRRKNKQNCMIGCKNICTNTKYFILYFLISMKIRRCVKNQIFSRDASFSRK